MLPAHPLREAIAQLVSVALARLEVGCVGCLVLFLCGVIRAAQMLAYDYTAKFIFMAETAMSP